MAKTVTAIFAKSAGGKYRCRLRLKPDEMVSLYARGSISKLITRAVRSAARRGLKLGACLIITQRDPEFGRQVVFHYQLDTIARFSR